METNEKLSQIKDTQIEKVSSEISNKENAKPENSQQKNKNTIFMKDHPIIHVTLVLVLSDL
jgi:hypothetical protein